MEVDRPDRTYGLLALKAVGSHPETHQVFQAIYEGCKDASGRERHLLSIPHPQKKDKKTGLACLVFAHFLGTTSFFSHTSCVFLVFSSFFFLPHQISSPFHSESCVVCGFGFGSRGSRSTKLWLPSSCAPITLKAGDEITVGFLCRV